MAANGSAGWAGPVSWPAHSPFSLGRVAQAGNGKSTASGTGITGSSDQHGPWLCQSGALPLRGGRYPYFGRAASAASSLPATRIAQFARIRRSTSLAVCCAPIKMTPKDRPRSAKSSRICLIGLSPSRGGVLVELIKHDEHQRPARALTLLTGKLGTQRDANHEPLRPVRQAMKVNDRHLEPATC